MFVSFASNMCGVGSICMLSKTVLTISGARASKVWRSACSWIFLCRLPQREDHNARNDQYKIAALHDTRRTITPPSRERAFRPIFRLYSYGAAAKAVHPSGFYSSLPYSSPIPPCRLLSAGKSISPFTLLMRSPLTLRSSCRISPLPSKCSVTPFSSAHSVPYSMTSSSSFYKFPCRILS